MSDALDTEVPRVTKWKGRDIRELSREELIEAVEWCAEAYHNAIEDKVRTVRMMAEFARAT